MATCTICGKEIGIFDSTTSYYDANGNQTEVHTACKDGQRSAQSFQDSPEMYTPEPEAPPSSWWPPSKKALIIGGGVVLAVVVGVVLGTRSGT